MQLYKIGDVCVGCNFTELAARFNGVECTIEGNIQEQEGYNFSGILCKLNGYLVEWADGAQYIVSQENLRLKRPPEELSSWDRVMEICGYNPTISPKTLEPA